MSQHKTNIADLLREIVAYCREAGHQWSSLDEAEAALATHPAQAAQSDEVTEAWCQANPGLSAKLINQLSTWLKERHQSAPSGISNARMATSQDNGKFRVVLEFDQYADASALHTWLMDRGVVHGNIDTSAAQAQQVAGEVVAWRYQDARGHYRYVGHKPHRKNFAAEYAILNPVPLYTTPPKQPAPVVPQLTPEMVNAAHRYLERFKYWPGFPAEFRWHDLWAAMLTATHTPPAQAAADARDAERWRAFMDCARIRFFGWAGYEEKDPNGDATGNYRHFGAEFWTIHDAPTADKENAKRILEGFADAALSTHQQGGK